MGGKDHSTCNVRLQETIRDVSKIDKRIKNI